MKRIHIEFPFSDLLKRPFHCKLLLLKVTPRAKMAVPKRKADVLEMLAIILIKPYILAINPAINFQISNLQHRVDSRGG